MQNKLWIPVLDNTKHQILDGLLLFWLYKEKNYNKPGKLVNNGATSVIAVDRNPIHVTLFGHSPGCY